MGTPLAEIFGEAPWVQELRGFAVRDADQLATLASSFQGRVALSQLQAQPKAEEISRLLADKAGLAQAASLAAAARQPHGLGYRIPRELSRLRFGDRVERAAFGFRSSPSDDEIYGAREKAVEAPPTKQELAALPSRFDLGAITTPVRDQGFRGTCVAFSATALLETKLWRDIMIPIDLSEQYVYFLARRNDPDRSMDGTFPRYAFDGLVANGACHESFWPYQDFHDWGQALTFEVPIHNLWMLESDALQRRVTAYRRVEATSVAALKAELFQQRLVCMCVPVFEFAWDLAWSSGEVTLPLSVPDSQGGEVVFDRIVGGHAISLCGWVDTPKGRDARPGGGYFIFKNSWSERWAAQNTFRPGFGFLPYAYVERYGFEAYALE